MPTSGGSNSAKQYVWPDSDVIGTASTGPGAKPDPSLAAAAAALDGYRAVMASILDPSGDHIDAATLPRSQNMQTNVLCDQKTGDTQLVMLGTTLGWTAGGALGVVRLQVVAPDSAEKPGIATDYKGWRDAGTRLPAGVDTARVTTYDVDGGGRAVVVARADGLTVAVDAGGRWGNNVGPGSPSATELPSIQDLLRLAASPRLEFPSP